MTSTPAVTVLVPVLDEVESVPKMVAEVTAAFEQIPEVTYELLFVDDGSTDGTWDEIAKLASADPRIRGVRLRRNFGKSTALANGVERARGETVITMDGDLQDDPAEIPRFLETVAQTGGLVSGWKQKRLDPLSKRLPSKVFNWVTSKACGLKMKDYNCGFKAAPMELYRSIPLYGEMHRFVPAMANNLGYAVTEIPVHHRAREFGRSKFGFERYLRGMLDLVTVLMLTRYNRRPGHFFGGLGVVMGLIGAVALAYLGVISFFTDDPVGARPLLSIGVLLEVVAVQLISIGVLAELLVHRTEVDRRVNLAKEEV